MCDNPSCGETFSEAEEGWTTTTQSKPKRSADGIQRTVTVTLDFCPECSGDPEETGRRLREARLTRREARKAIEAPARSVKSGRGSHLNQPYEDAVPE
jgi:hypothetical protein